VRADEGWAAGAVESKLAACRHRPQLQRQRGDDFTPLKGRRMHPVFAKLVDDADSIKTSGRWAAVNEEIKRLAQDLGADTSWYVEVFGSLCYNVFLNTC
jgi:hypothetical protein